MQLPHQLSISAPEDKGYIIYHEKGNIRSTYSTFIEGQKCLFELKVRIETRLIAVVSSNRLSKRSVTEVHAVCGGQLILRVAPSQTTATTQGAGAYADAERIREERLHRSLRIKSAGNRRRVGLVSSLGASLDRDDLTHRRDDPARG